MVGATGEGINLLSEAGIPYTGGAEMLLLGRTSLSTYQAIGNSGGAFRRHFADRQLASHICDHHS